MMVRFVRMLLLTAPLLLLLCAPLVLGSSAAADSQDGKPKEGTVFLLFTESCYVTFFEEFDFFNVACLKSLISKGLGLAIIAGSFLLKAPQIYNIVAAKSGKGLALSSLYFDVAAFICPAVYSFRQGFPFLSYGESVVILVQNGIIVLLVWVYGTGTEEDNKGKATEGVSLLHKIGVVVTLCAATFAAFSLPQEYAPVLPSIAMALTIASRLPQVVSNLRTKNTGVASSITWTLNFLGGVARVLTTLNETGDVFQLAGFVLGASFSFIILAQICLYKGSGAESKKKDA